MKREEAAANSAVPITGLTDGHDSLRLRALAALEPAHAHPPASHYAVARPVVEGGLLEPVIFDQRTGEKVNI
jgi:hypothetical protein